MESNLKRKVDAHQISLDLEGLDEFLEASPAEVELVTVEPVVDGASEDNKLILRLLQEVIEVNAAIEVTRERLAAANERMTSLHTVVQLQTKQLEMMAHYQSQAARVTALEHEIDLLKFENAKLKQVWWRRIINWFKS